MRFLSNDWLIWFYNTYSIAIIALPVMIIFILKLISIVNPKIHTDKVVDLIKEYWPVKQLDK